MSYREIAPNSAYHIYNRATLAVNIYKCDRDYNKFIGRLHEYALKLDVKILAFCIMPNHFHLILKEPDVELLKQGASRISSLMQRLIISYTKHYFTKYKHSGVVFESKFKSKMIPDESYYLTLREYILDNPVRKGLVKHRNDWPYSYMTSDF